MQNKLDKLVYTLYDFIDTIENIFNIGYELENSFVSMCSEIKYPCF